MDEVLLHLENMLVLHATLNRGNKSSQYYKALKVLRKYKSHEQEGADTILPNKRKRETDKFHLD